MFSIAKSRPANDADIPSRPTGHHFPSLIEREYTLPPRIAKPTYAPSTTKEGQQ